MHMICSICRQYLEFSCFCEEQSVVNPQKTFYHNCLSHFLKPSHFHVSWSRTFPVFPRRLPLFSFVFLGLVILLLLGIFDPRTQCLLLELNLGVIPSSVLEPGGVPGPRSRCGPLVYVASYKKCPAKLYFVLILHVVFSLSSIHHAYSLKSD